MSKPSPQQRVLKQLQNPDFESQRVYDDLIQLASRLTECPIAALTLIDGEILYLKSRVGKDEHQLPKAGTFCETAVLGTGLFEVEDASTDTRFKDHPIIKAQNLKFYAGVPLMFQGVAIGNLCVSDTQVRKLTEVQRESLTSLARLAMAHIEKQAALKDVGESELFLDQLIEQYPNMVFVKDAKSLKYVRFNRAGENLSGLKREELLGKSDIDIFPKEQAEFFNSRDRIALNSGKIVEISEEVISTRVLGDRILRTKKVPILGADGVPKYLLGISDDITEIRQISAERDRFFTASLDMLAISDFSGYFKSVNPVVTEILGYTPEEFCAVPYLSLIHPEDVAATEAQIQVQADGTSIHAFENRVRCKNGSYKWISWRSTPVGKVMYGCGRDVTVERESRAKIEQMNLELERRVEERTAQVTEASKRFEAVVSSNLIGIIFWTAQGELTDVNDAFLEMVGYTRQDLKEGKLRWLELTPPEHAEKDQNAIVEIRTTGRCRPYEKEFIRKNGSRIAISIGAAQLDGRVDHGVAYVLDLTEMKRMESERNTLSLSAQTAVAASQMKSEFLANMSHEIRTPMNGIIGMLSLLNDMPLDITEKEYADAAKSSADALLTVINDILDFSKVEAGKLEFEDIDFELHKLFEDVNKAFIFQARAKGLTLSFEIDPDLPVLVGGDPGRIKQVLNNLLSNAIKFTQHGHVTVHVRSEPAREGRVGVRVEILDTGIGISPVAISRMFQAFAQADTSTTRKFGGTGLGLSISKHLVEKMNGVIGVDSVEGQGSEFWFTLNLRLSKSRIIDPTGPVGTFATSKRSLRVLIAEDNPINQKIALKLLEKLGLKADAVANGKEVIEAIRIIKYDLILMDCQMPEMDGYEATRTIRASTTLPQTSIPIVAMTANAMKGERERCLESGMNDYISKPAKINALYEVLSRWLKTN